MQSKSHYIIIIIIKNQMLQVEQHTDNQTTLVLYHTLYGYSLTKQRVAILLLLYACMATPMLGHASATWMLSAKRITFNRHIATKDTQLQAKVI